MNKFYTKADYIKASDKYDLNPDYFMVSTGISDAILPT